MVVAAASPMPIIRCQKSMAGTVTINPPAEANVEETPICIAHAKAPRIIEDHDAINTLAESLFRLGEEPERSLTV